MALTVDELLIRAPSFDCVDVSLIQLAIDEAECRVNRTNFGSLADTAVLYLAAHILEEDAALSSTVAGKSGSAVPAGAIKSETLETWSASYSDNGAFKNESLSTTAWGRRFVSLRRGIFACRV